MSTSPILSLPFIQPSQAQKHVTHNLAIELLDALVQMSVTDLSAGTAPSEPFDGQVVVVGEGAEGEFTGQDGKLACFANGGWIFIPPRNGFKAWVEEDAAFYVFHEGMWQMLLSTGSDRTNGLGLNAAWDSDNRLSVSSPGTLLSHEGADHRLKINKAGPGDTASLLLQTGFSGRAEIGLAGGEDLSIKVSADGSAWSTALSVAAASGNVRIGALELEALSGAAVQASASDTTPGRLMRADWGYGPGNVVGPVTQSGGTPTGAVIESGSTPTGTYVRFADGTQICAIPKLRLSRAAGHNMRETWIYPVPFADGTTPTVTHTADLTSATVYATNSGERIYWGVSSTYALFDRALIDLYRTNGAPNIPEGATVLTACQAIGRWF